MNNEIDYSICGVLWNKICLLYRGSVMLELGLGEITLAAILVIAVIAGLVSLAQQGWRWWRGR